MKYRGAVYDSLLTSVSVLSLSLSLNSCVIPKDKILANNVSFLFLDQTGKPLAGVTVRRGYSDCNVNEYFADDKSSGPDGKVQFLKVSKSVVPMFDWNLNLHGCKGVMNDYSILFGKGFYYFQPDSEQSFSMVLEVNTDARGAVAFVQKELNPPVKARSFQQERKLGLPKD